MKKARSPFERCRVFARGNETERESNCSCDFFPSVLGFSEIFSELSETLAVVKLSRNETGTRGQRVGQVRRSERQLKRARPTNARSYVSPYVCNLPLAVRVARELEGWEPKFTD